MKIIFKKISFADVMVWATFLAYLIIIKHIKIDVNSWSAIVFFSFKIVFYALSVSRFEAYIYYPEGIVPESKDQAIIKIYNFFRTIIINVNDITDINNRYILTNKRKHKINLRRKDIQYLSEQIHNPCDYPITNND